ncbi:tetratricopeptide repeat protein [Ferrovibrio sp.]|uniref:tetratricopeptide repeat protein n=1 Tax=Ferrovibrio sp. TaxID=1917215 RepID=UPI003D09F98D
MTKPSDILLQQSGIGGEVDVPVAFDLLNKGELELAGAAFTRILQKQPRSAEALFGLGQIAQRRGDAKEAAQFYSRAVQANRMLIEPHMALGNVFQAMGRLSQAYTAYKEGLSVAPGYAPLHFNIGVCLRRMGEHDAGIAALKNAVKIQPDHVMALFSLGNAYRDREDLATAEQYYRDAVRIHPDYADAQCNLGGLLSQRKAHEEAAACFDAALRVVPNHFVALKNRSLSLFQLGRFEEGAANAAAALRQQPDDMMLHYHMGEMIYGLMRSGQVETARRHAKEWAAAYPDNSVAQHMAAAALGEGAPSRADDAYVRETFDRFSADFEKVLGGLEYRAPQLLEAAIAARIGSRNGLSILDAGCGTGLCAPLLKPRAAKLIGVDLSGGMLAKAEGRGYDALHEAELGAFLRGTPESYDLTVAADVFCYFGDLAPLLADLAPRMPQGALLAFTVERIDGEAPATGFRLNPTGRYAHAGSYLQDVLTQHGFGELQMIEDAARVEMGVPVPCYVVTAQRV